MCGDVCNVVKGSMLGVMKELDSAKDLAESAPSDYEALLSAVIEEASSRLRAHRKQVVKASRKADTVPHVQQLKEIMSLYELAVKCIEHDRHDEALLHLGMLGFYLERLANMPVMQLEPSDMKRILQALDYHFDLTENQAEDDQNKALINKLYGESGVVS